MRHAGIRTAPGGAARAARRKTADQLWQGAGGRPLSATGFLARAGTGEGYESDGQDDVARDGAVGALFDEQQLLLAEVRFDGNDHLSAGLELLDELLRDRRCGCGHDDAVEGRLLRPALITVADAHL